MKFICLFAISASIFVTGSLGGSPTSTEPNCAIIPDFIGHLRICVSAALGGFCQTTPGRNGDCMSYSIDSGYVTAQLMDAGKWCKVYKEQNCVGEMIAVGNTQVDLPWHLMSYQCTYDCV